MKTPDIISLFAMAEDLKEASRMFRGLGTGDWQHGMSSLLRKAVPSPKNRLVIVESGPNKLNEAEFSTLEICTRLGMMIVKGYLEAQDDEQRDGSGKRDPEVPGGSARQESRTND